MRFVVVVVKNKCLGGTVHIPICGCSSHAQILDQDQYALFSSSSTTQSQFSNNRRRVFLSRCFPSQITRGRLAFSDSLSRPVVNTSIHTKKCSRTVSVAFSILSAYVLRFMCLSIISEDNKSAVGLAKPLPRQIRIICNMSDARYIPSITYRRYPVRNHGRPQKWTHPNTRKNKFH